MAFALHTNSEVRAQLRAGLVQTLPTLLGSFRHKDTDAFFEYGDRLDVTNPARDFPDYPHLIFMSDGSTRYAHVRHTVAWVIVEDQAGEPYAEKWRLKQHRVYPTEWVYA